MREFLKGLGLTDELIDTIMAEHGKLMTRSTETIDQLKDQVRDLKDAAKPFEGVDLEALNNQITTLTTDKENAESEHKKAITALKKDYAIKAAVAKSAPLDEIAYMAHLDKDKIVFNEETGELTGFKEQDDAIHKDYAYMFNAAPGGEEHGGFDGDSTKTASLADAVADYYK